MSKHKKLKIFLWVGLALLTALLLVFFAMQKQQYKKRLQELASQSSVLVEFTPEMQMQQEDLSLVAHRGYTKDAPENTLASIKAAGEANFWGCEFDIRRTADGQWVLMHDETLARTLGPEIAIKDTSYADLQIYSYGQDENDAPIHIPTLKEALMVCKSYDMMAYVEVKCAEMPATYAKEINEILKACGMEGQSTVISFDENFAACMKACAPNVFTALLTKNLSKEEIRFAEDNKIGLDVRYQVPKNKEALLQEAADKGLLYSCWTVNDADSIYNLHAIGIRTFTTDDILPELMAPIIKFQMQN